MQIAIMNDCDALDVRDFETIRTPWADAGIPIDWCFFLHGNMTPSHNGDYVEIFKEWGRTYEDYRQFAFTDESVKHYIDSGLLRTIHMSIPQVFKYYSELSEILKQMREPILTGHGAHHKTNKELWSNFLNEDPLSHKFFAISNMGIVTVDEDTEIVTGKTFKRIPPRAKTKQVPHYERLVNQLKRACGHSVILSTHLAHKYSSENREQYLFHVRKTINYMDANDIEVISIRKFIKMMRTINREEK